ncbi:salt tolerance down-regulator-domain-containing protein [Armillaria luteobubalina]|uniref:Stress response protein NST1 n=1 Tax=Armillaria luteobubalina TaxID=153913 RepID=A0AA39TLU2_9AGAR|nr:salt tolerance down-regulator-domain-containing protein [Armillaria luteobubalina]
MAPVGRQPSQVSIGKKPMAYPTTQPQATQAPAKSARAASKAPIPPNAYNNNTATNAHHHPSPPPSKRPPTTTAPSTTKANKIWSTSSTEERERIKDFWLGLGEEERRNLVKIEKDTVLRKMKEQQKHSCSCAVCGRKRNAIEEELEVLGTSLRVALRHQDQGRFPVQWSSTSTAPSSTTARRRLRRSGLSKCSNNNSSVNRA